MRLFGVADGQINEFDRAVFLTPPFDASFGVGASWEAPFTVDFAQQWSVTGSVAFEYPVCSAPVNPLAVHIGNGAMLVTWQQPLTGQASGYEVWAATEVSGSYYKFSNNEFTATHGLLNNFPIGQTIYLRVRAKSPNGLFGAYAQFRSGKINYPTIKMKVRSVSGSIISAGSVFSKQVSGSRLLAVKALSEISIP